MKQIIEPVWLASYIIAALYLVSFAHDLMNVKSTFLNLAGLIFLVLIISVTTYTIQSTFKK